jgi:hypothetical protein
MLRVMGLFAGVAVCLSWGGHVRAEIVFSDAFNYSLGNLVGQNGGTGFSAAYTGSGTGTVVQAPLPGTSGKSVAITTGSAVFRNLTASRTTGGATSFFMSYVSRVGTGVGNGSSGISLFNGANEMNFLGVPSLSSSKLGMELPGVGRFTWSGSTTDVTYLQMFEFKDNGSNTLVNMYASSDLTLTGNQLVALGVRASGVQNDFTFDSIRLASTANGYSVGGFAMATTANEAVGFTTASVPEPGTLLLGGIAAACGGGGVWWKRRKGKAVEGEQAAGETVV